VPATRARLTTSSSASGATGSSASPDLRPQPREEVFASPDLRPRPQEEDSTSPDLKTRPQPRPREESRPRLTPPRPQEKSLPRPTLGSDRPRHKGYIITLPLASSGYEGTRLTSPVTGNDGSPRASMTTVVLSPLRKKGDVSRIPAAPTAVLLQGSGTSLTATLSHTQGSSTSPTATLACTQGSGTSLPDTLAHSYTPIVHLDPLLASIKGRSRAFMREGHAEGTSKRTGSLSLPCECL
jgi:hypothetical protein